MDLTIFLLWISIPFVLATAYFGTRNGYYDSDKYDGDGCAHDVKRWNQDPIFNCFTLKIDYTKPPS